MYTCIHHSRKEGEYEERSIEMIDMKKIVAAGAIASAAVCVESIRETYCIHAYITRGKRVSMKSGV